MTIDTGDEYRLVENVYVEVSLEKQDSTDTTTVSETTTTKKETETTTKKEQETTHKNNSGSEETTSGETYAGEDNVE